MSDEDALWGLEFTKHRPPLGSKVALSHLQSSPHHACLLAYPSLPLSLSLKYKKKNQTTDISPVNQMIHEITTINLAAIKIVLAKWLCSNYAIQYTEWDPLHYTM